VIFFEKAENIVVLSTFFTGGNPFVSLKDDQFTFRYLTNKIKIEKCNLNDEECAICDRNLDKILKFG